MKHFKPLALCVTLTLALSVCTMPAHVFSAFAETEQQSESAVYETTTSSAEVLSTQEAVSEGSSQKNGRK